MKNKRNNIIIAGGKTGGHLFPGIAVAQALKAQNPEVNILFVGTCAPFETRTLKSYGFSHRAILARPIKGGSILKKTHSTGMVMVSLAQALAILIRFRADFVLGVGGFSSFSVVLAAFLLRIPRAIQEQNAVPGITNRILARFANTIFTAFETTKGLSENPKTRYVGNPVRRKAPTLGKGKKQASPADKNQEFTILVTGGSQGASSINTAFLEAIKSMEDKKDLSIIHQTGIADETSIRAEYLKLDIKADARAFFEEMPRLQDLADLVITRAGAGSISELSIKGKPSILIPYPHAADDHQTANAKVIADRGAAILIHDKDLTGQGLKHAIESLKEDRGKLEKMSRAFKAMAMTRADEIIAGHILETEGPGPKKTGE